MTAIDLKFGIPDIELGCASGAKINPSSFAGHELVVLFCPLDPDAAASEMEAYLRHTDKFVEHDAWLLTFAERCEDIAVERDGRLLTIADPDQQAWTAFCNLTGHPEKMDRAAGATFLFTRGGNLHRYWHGPGHLAELLAEFAKPSSGHPHQIVR